MIDISLLRNKDTRKEVVSALQKRGVDQTALEELVALDQEWREVTAGLEAIRAEKREASTAIVGSSSDMKPLLIQKMQSKTDEEKELEKKSRELTEKRDAIWCSIPNIPLADVQAGGEDDFEIIAESAIKPKPKEETPYDYVTLLGDQVDMERGAKVSGARFTYLKGDLARLEIGIVSYLMDMLSREGFTPVIPPVLVQEAAMAGMGYLDQAGDEVYKTQDDLYLVGTSEQSLGAMHMNEIIPTEDLPLRYVGYSTCFRREAGSHGKDVRGILRLHQFNKVEMFSIVPPEQSEQEHQFLLSQQRKIMDSLELPYRVIRLAAGDLGGPSAKTYDIETWIPSEGRYRETHSTSNTTDYQSRRLNIRTKTEGGSPEKVHMLNGTAVAISRLLIALIENHQQLDGSIHLPASLHPYLPFSSLSLRG
jgi:seryl-tRNA synthetase